MAEVARRTRRNIDAAIPMSVGHLITLVSLIAWYCILHSGFRLTLFGSRRNDGMTSTPASATHRQPPACRDIYRLSSVLYRDETTPLISEHLCSPPSGGSRANLKCLEERARRLGRLTSVLFFGDSRLRKVYEVLAADLNLTVPARDPDDAAYGRIRAGVDSSPQHWCAVCDKCCPLQSVGSLIKLEFLWRPYLSEPALRSLRQLASRCESTTDCPDLVVMNGALWYMPELQPSLTAGDLQMAALLRRQMAAAATDLRRLARRTRVVWRLDERPHLEMAGSPFGSSPLLSVVHALVFHLQSQVPDLTVWTSGLPDTTGFLRRLCYPLRTGGLTRPADYATFMAECAWDPLHGSDRLRRRAIATILADLCAGCSLVELSDPERPGKVSRAVNGDDDSERAPTAIPGGFASEGAMPSSRVCCAV